MTAKRPRIDKVTTTHGDSGMTSLADGKRYHKSSERVALVGALDELNCAISSAALAVDGDLHDQLRLIQSRLFDLGAAVATGEPQPFWQREAERLTSLTEQLNQQLAPLTEFVLPGGNEANARLHLARSTARRCEREFWRLNDPTLIEATLGIFLNRLSDYLFVAARVLCADEVLWQPLKE